MYRSFVSLVVCGVAVLSTGCSGSGVHTAPLAVGTLGGAAVGAGTGAIIGSVIANGDVAASALLGGAIGIPVGLAVGALYDYNSEQSVSERKAEEIKNNQAEIFARQRQIDDLREQIRGEGALGNPSEQLREYHYNSPSLGDYYR